MKRLHSQAHVNVDRREATNMDATWKCEVGGERKSLTTLTLVAFPNALMNTLGSGRINSPKAGGFDAQKSRSGKDFVRPTTNMRFQYLWT